MITQHEKNSLPNILVSEEYEYFIPSFRKSLTFSNNLLIPNLKQNKTKTINR